MICADVFRLLPGLEVLQLPHIVHATDGSIPSLPTWTMSGSTSAQYQLSAVRLTDPTCCPSQARTTAWP